MRTSSFRWWFLLVVALLIVFLWPAGDSKSLALKFVNWAVDPWDELPILPPPLPLRAGDDPQAVEFHDIQTQQYDAVYQRGGWPRMRLTLKVADDPLDPSTERQMLTALAVVAAFLGWRWRGETSERRPTVADSRAPPLHSTSVLAGALGDPAAGNGDLLHRPGRTISFVEDRRRFAVELVDQTPALAVVQAGLGPTE
jgi:hypothetical protein